MSEPVQVFERYEKKYLLTSQQYTALRAQLAPLFTADKYGRHTIQSLYYDTEDFALIRASLARPSYKEKLRLRAYGVPEENDTVFLEIKKKVNHVVYKRRVPLTLQQAREYDANGACPDAENQIWQEILWMNRRYALCPKALIACERIALFGTQNEALRVTFDFDIRFRAFDLDLAHGSEGTLLAPGQILMEVKIPGALPFALARIFSELALRPVSFSKYGTAYQNYLSAAYAAQGGHHA